MENVGVHRLRLHGGSMTCSDLCQGAAEQLLRDVGWRADEIDLLVYVSQSMDYVLPATSCVLHGKMGLRTDCHCFDIALGCSGWVYGLSVVANMVQSGVYRKALLLAGDARGMTKRKISEAARAKSRAHETPLFGDAGTATALSYDETADEMVIETCTDGTGYEAIIKRAGGSRCPVTHSALRRKEDAFGHVHRAVDTEMDGAAVFVFGISRIPKAVKGMLRHTGQTVDTVEYFLFHQANLMMNEQIRRKCGIPPEKCPYSLRDFGNNSSASIPLTIVTQIRDHLMQPGSHPLLACGFGVGLSWATAHLQLQDTVISPLLEL